MFFSDSFSLGKALLCSIFRLNPRNQIRNPVMFSVFIGLSIVLIELIRSIISSGALASSSRFLFWCCLWLLLTILFSNFSESVAEQRSKAQISSLKGLQENVQAKILDNYLESSNKEEFHIVQSVELKKGDIVYVEAGDMIPRDGEIIEGIASVNESAITGESAPVIRESGGDRSSVTGGTKVISDWLVIRISANTGETFIDKMIALVESSKRRKTPNELALHTLLITLTIVFVLASVTVLPFVNEAYGYTFEKAQNIVSISMIVALFVCLAPTTIGGLLSSIGIAGMSRMMKKNIISMSGKAVETAGDIDVLILDKTGTITFGNRHAVEFMPEENISELELAEKSYLSSVLDETPEGRSILELAKSNKYGVDENIGNGENIEFVPFSANTRMSGADIDGIRIRKGAIDSIKAYVESFGMKISEYLNEKVNIIAKNGGTPLVVADQNKIYGAIYLKDIVKSGIKERFANLRMIGIKTIMVTGDNYMTATTIAAEAGVDDFLAQSNPMDKLELIKKLQKDGMLVAMTGDGTNDVPALAQADVAVVMNSGTQEAKEAGNMIDLDSDPTKLIDIVEIGKQLLITRGAITTFSIANDIAKYFAILPAIFIGISPVFDKINIMHLTNPNSAILSALIFNALIILLLIPFSMHGVRYKRIAPSKMLRNNILIYGISGIITPFFGIKLIDIVLSIL